MSSELFPRHLSNEDLELLQTALNDAGYIGDHQERQVAAKLLLSWYQDGMRDPSDLANELDRQRAEASLFPINARVLASTQHKARTK